MDFLNHPIPKSFSCSSDGWDEFLKNLQANIVKHHNRPYAHFVFIRFESPEQVEKIKHWIADFSVHITTAYKHLTTPQKKDSPEWMLRSCLISREGISFLSLQNANINFPQNEYSEIYQISDDEGKTEDFFKNDSHLLILLAHTDECQLLNFIQVEIFNSLQSQNIDYNFQIEEGFLKKNEQKKAIDAFGFRDGISQPEVFQERIDQYRTEAWNPAATLGLAFFDMKTNDIEDYGSFAVYLKIKQDKVVFDKNVEKIAGSIRDDLDEDQKKDLAAAYLIGRFKDGTPVIKSNKKGGQDMNNFNYGPRPDYASTKNKCPLFAHIFKSNPRDKPDIRIFRRGIPFQGADGLHFLSYQSDIDKQFLQIYRGWIGNRTLPGHTIEFGRDPIMTTDSANGADPSSSPKPIPKVWGEDHAANSDLYFHMRELELPKPTTVSGAVFYFVPSLYFLKNIQSL